MSQIKTADRHAVKVKSAQFGESAKGTPFLELEFVNAQAETLLGWLYLSEKAIEDSVRRLREVFGFDNNFETLIAQVEGKECSIVTEFETYEGKERLRVKFINGVRREAQPIKDTGALARFSALAKRIPVEAPKKAPAAAAADGAFPT